jgi:hypothetical protein
MTQPFPLPLKGDMYFIDNSSMTDITACPRKAMYKHLGQRQLRKNRAALFFGGAIHKALEVRDRINKPLVDNEVRGAMVEALVEYFADTDIGDDYRNLDYAIRTIDHYNSVYKFDPAPPIPLSDGSLAVELPFAVSIGRVYLDREFVVTDPDLNDGKPTVKHIDSLQIVFTGKIDRIVKAREGGLLLFDHKTSSIGGPNFFSEFFTALQFRGYKFAAEQLLQQPFLGVTINGLICRPPLRNGSVNFDMDRQTIYIADSMVSEWHNTFLLLVANWLKTIATQVEFPDNPEQAFPLHTGSCIAKYGTCEYFDICQLPPEQRRMVYDSPLYEPHSWSPLDDPAKPKPVKVEPQFGGLLDHLF